MTTKYKSLLSLIWGLSLPVFAFLATAGFAYGECKTYQPIFEKPKEKTTNATGSDTARLYNVGAVDNSLSVQDGVATTETTGTNGYMPVDLQGNPYVSNITYIDQSGKIQTKEYNRAVTYEEFSDFIKNNIALDEDDKPMLEINYMLPDDIIKVGNKFTYAIDCSKPPYLNSSVCQRGGGGGGNQKQSNTRIYAPLTTGNDLYLTGYNPVDSQGNSYVSNITYMGTDGRVHSQDFNSAVSEEEITSFINNNAALNSNGRPMASVNYMLPGDVAKSGKEFTYLTFQQRQERLAQIKAQNEAAAMAQNVANVNSILSDLGLSTVANFGNGFGFTADTVIQAGPDQGLTMSQANTNTVAGSYGGVNLGLTAFEVAVLAAGPSHPDHGAVMAYFSGGGWHPSDPSQFELGANGPTGGHGIGPAAANTFGGLNGPTSAIGETNTPGHGSFTFDATNPAADNNNDGIPDGVTTAANSTTDTATAVAVAGATGNSDALSGDAPAGDAGDAPAGDAPSGNAAAGDASTGDAVSAIGDAIGAIGDAIGDAVAAIGDAFGF